MRLASLIISMMLATVGYSAPPEGMPYIIHIRMHASPELAFPTELSVLWSDSGGAYQYYTGAVLVYAVPNDPWDGVLEWTFQSSVGGVDYTFEASYPEGFGPSVGFENGELPNGPSFMSAVVIGGDYGWDWVPEKQIFLFLAGFGGAFSAHAMYAGASWFWRGWRYAMGQVFN